MADLEYDQLLSINYHLSVEVLECVSASMAYTTPPDTTPGLFLMFCDEMLDDRLDVAPNIMAVVNQKVNLVTNFQETYLQVEMMTPIDKSIPEVKECLPHIHNSITVMIRQLLHCNS